MLVIWGRTNSVNVQKVLRCCEELGIEYRRIDAGGPFGVVDTPEYRRRNPNGLVPTIDDDGFVLWESNAIVRYLAAKHPSSLWPADPRVRAEADQWMDWTTRRSGLRSARHSWASSARRRSSATRPPSRNRCAGPQRSSSWWTTTCGSRPYLAGDEFTVGDIALGAGIWRWMAMPIERPARPARRAVVRGAVPAPGLPEDRDVAADLTRSSQDERSDRMGKARMEAFSDGVIAVIITIMVLEMKVPHGDDLATLQPRHPGVRQLRAELRLRRHLLEQPPPHAPRGRQGERRHSLGQPAPAVLAVAHSVRHGLDGREPFRADAGRAVRRGAADVRHLVLHPEPRADPARRRELDARDGRWATTSRAGSPS